MSVKAKFKCDAITHYEHSKEIKASPVIGYSGENAEFTKYTPSGQLTMLIDNESKAAELFAPGKEFYLTFEEA